MEKVETAWPAVLGDFGAELSVTALFLCRNLLDTPTSPTQGECDLCH